MMAAWTHHPQWLPILCLNQRSLPIGPQSDSTAHLILMHLWGTLAMCFADHSASWQGFNYRKCIHKLISSCTEDRALPRIIIKLLLQMIFGLIITNTIKCLNRGGFDLPRSVWRIPSEADYSIEHISM